MIHTVIIRKGLRGNKVYRLARIFFVRQGKENRAYRKYVRFFLTQYNEK